MDINKVCLICGVGFITIASRVKRGHGIYCSWKCNNKSKIKEKIVRNCLFCKKEFFPRRKTVNEGQGNYCSRKCLLTVRNKKDIYDWKIRFFENIFNIENKDICWEWIGKKDMDGYGMFHSKLLNTYRAHRISYILHFGEIPKDILVCHKCDNPSCVNPNHLFLGTDKDNAYDRINKKRDMKTRGVNHYKAKLNEDNVISIRERMRNGESCSAIARELNMNQSTINAIKHNKSWKHLL